MCGETFCGRHTAQPQELCLRDGKSEVYQWYLDDYRDNLRSTSGILMTIGKVGGLPVVSG